jgi:uncharacterized cofD-like protein
MSLDMVKRVWLSSEVNSNPEAVSVLNSADLIIISPGSLYGSILTNFLPKGMKTAFEKSKAKKILITNIMSVCNETNNFDQDQYVKIIKDYVNIDFDLILMTDLLKIDKKILDKVLNSYANEHSHPISLNLKGKHKAVLADIVSLDEVNLRLRHSVDKLAKFFAKMEYVTKEN